MDLDFQNPDFLKNVEKNYSHFFRNLSLGGDCGWTDLSFAQNFGVGFKNRLSLGGGNFGFDVANS